MKKTSDKVEQRLPFAPLYLAFAYIAKAVLKIFYGLEIHKSCKIKGPAIVLCNHPSSVDFIIVAAALLPLRLSFLAAYYFFIISRPLNRILRLMGAIPKFQFAPDVSAIRSMDSLLNKKGGVLCIMPEGTVSGSGRLGYINPAIAKLVRHFKVPVYIVRTNGGSVSFPKWANHSRRGKIQVDVFKLFEADELKSMSSEDINNTLHDALNYNDFEFIKRSGAHYSSAKKAEGLENLLMICPKCHREFTLTTLGNNISCSCGLCAELDSSMNLCWGEGTAWFNSLNEWYDYQENFYAEQTLNPDFELCSHVRYFSNSPGIGPYMEIGDGIMTMTREGIGFTGMVRGEKHEFFEPMKNIPALVYDIGKNFELPYHSAIRCFEPDIKSSSVKWSLCLRFLYDREFEKQHV